MTTPGSRLRELLRTRQPVVAPFVFDGLQAKLATAAGFEAVYMTGFGTAAARGLPDVGLLGLSEMLENVRVLVRAAGVPVICDADTGYGNPVNVWHTVREYERAGAAGLHLEDQVWPKRCGFLAGKQVISLQDMLPKVRAACAARRDPDFVVIARTDALAALGWEEAVRRARAYRDAGADLVFVDGIRTRGDMERYARSLEGIPLVYNGQLPVAEVAACGFKLMLHIGTLLAAFERMRAAMEELAATGAISAGPALDRLEDLARLLGLEEVEAIGRRYTPE
ncbi:MAG TPA: carboxyvinyl-carboxyphosphonate phosphorylmutase [Deltaproteobacteria bacterium]|jgi:2-methylisocitrate lyase-like PEP mutase family enzyme|nr:carboxyvinyl-carboxyphosphonate phosphorylmutase [Deltaproteobacteria bacterium]